MKRRPGPRPFLVDCAPMMSARTLGAFLERTAALLSPCRGCRAGRLRNDRGR